MFNFQMALLPWNGEHVSLLEFAEEAQRSSSPAFGRNRPEIGVRELLLALEHQWIVEEPSGQLHIQVPDSMVA